LFTGNKYIKNNVIIYKGDKIIIQVIFQTVLFNKLICLTSYIFGTDCSTNYVSYQSDTMPIPAISSILHTIGQHSTPLQMMSTVLRQSGFCQPYLLQWRGNHNNHPLSLSQTLSALCLELTDECDHRSVQQTCFT